MLAYSQGYWCFVNNSEFSFMFYILKIVLTTKGTKRVATGKIQTCMLPGNKLLIFFKIKFVTNIIILFKTQ